MAGSLGHASFFSYPISRPFPFRWFTPVAIVGGIIFIVLFTFLNFAANIYELVVQNSLDPNATISGGSWLQHWPSYLTTKVRPTCQPANLPVDSQFFTNQTALTYTLAGIWEQHETGGGRAISPSLSYYNNVLQNCSVTSVEVDLTSLDRSAQQFAFSEWGAVLRSSITCRILGPAGMVLFNLTQKYDYIPDTTPFGDIYRFLGTGFLSRNQTSRASLWWGESLMSVYWGAVTERMYQERVNKTNNGEAGIRKGTVSFTRNESSSDIQDAHFFDTDHRFFVDRDGGAYDAICCPDLPSPLSAASLAAANIYPNIWTSIDTLVKAAYSTILTDLGQTTGAPNILTDAALLTHFFRPNSTIIEQANFRPGPANDSFEVLGATTGPLGTTPSVISTSYLCQVPRLKSVGNLIVAILIADLVLLQTVWQLYKFMAEAHLAKHQTALNHCEGCLGGLGGEQPGNRATPSKAAGGGDSEYHPLVDMSTSANRHNSVQKPAHDMHGIRPCGTS